VAYFFGATLYMVKYVIRWMAPFYFPKLIQINCDVLLRMIFIYCQIWFISNKYLHVLSHAVMQWPHFLA